MLAISSAIAEHSARIMFFRHDGTGLPEKKGGVLHIILAIALAARTLRDLADPQGFSLTVSVIASLIYVVMAVTLFRPATMAALLLANLFGYVVVGALYLAGISNGYLENAVIVWELIALSVVMNKIVSRARAAHKTQKSSNNLK